MESTKLPKSIDDIPEDMRDAIQQLIDQKVEEKFNSFMSEYKEAL